LDTDIRDLGRSVNVRLGGMSAVPLMADALRRATDMFSNVPILLQKCVADSREP
jgi:hypothetical protein